MIAQEVQKVIPSAVKERHDGYLKVDYTRLVPLLLESIKELSQKIEVLESKSHTHGIERIMPLQSSGRIKMSELATKFGGSGSHKLSEYYRGGSQVRRYWVKHNHRLPTSGKILSDFYGTGNPVLSVLNNGNYYSAYGAILMKLTSASRGSNTSLILAYVANVKIKADLA